MPHAQAELVATDQVDTSRSPGDSPRERMNTLFDRADVRAALEKQGVSVDEARSRVNALSDDEVETLAARFDTLPAAGSGFEALLWIGFVTFIVLLVTDILGFTKVFSFTRPAK
jgi:hypothetical protein